MSRAKLHISLLAVVLCQYVTTESDEEPESGEYCCHWMKRPSQVDKLSWGVFQSA